MAPTIWKILIPYLRSPLLVEHILSIHHLDVGIIPLYQHFSVSSVLRHPRQAYVIPRYLGGFKDLVIAQAVTDTVKEP